MLYVAVQEENTSSHLVDLIKFSSTTSLHGDHGEVETKLYQMSVDVG